MCREYFFNHTHWMEASSGEFIWISTFCLPVICGTVQVQPTPTRDIVARTISSFYVHESRCINIVLIKLSMITWTNMYKYSSSFTHVIHENITSSSCYQLRAQRHQTKLFRISNVTARAITNELFSSRKGGNAVRTAVCVGVLHGYFHMVIP